MQTLRRQKTGGSEFLALHHMRIVAISVALRDQNGFRIWSLGSEDSDEAELIDRFFRGIEKYTPTELSEIFKKQVKEGDWYINNDAKEKLSKFFGDRKEYFPHFGGDTETLFAKVKICHSRRVFGKPRYMKKEITYQDLKKGYELFKQNSHLTRNKKNRPPLGMYV